MSASVQLKSIEEFLRTQGFKLTRPRRRVVEKLLSVRGHVSADDLYEQLRRSGSPVSRATVYRTLSIVSKSGMIDGHDFDGARRVYESMVGRAHHDHLYCIDCQAVIEFQDEGIERLQERVVEKHRFRPVYHSHKIFGYCESCAGKRK
jgi:Fur family ferric uptake transcriptional regulator